MDCESKVVRICSNLIGEELYVLLAHVFRNKNEPRTSSEITGCLKVVDERIVKYIVLIDNSFSQCLEKLISGNSLHKRSCICDCGVLQPAFYWPKSMLYTPEYRKLFLLLFLRELKELEVLRTKVTSFSKGNKELGNRVIMATDKRRYLVRLLHAFGRGLP